MQYDKLIRDLIPQIMDSKGVKYKIHRADEAEYINKLKEKLHEETAEYLKDNNPEEIADILEVVKALLKEQLQQEVESYISDSNPVSLGNILKLLNAFSQIHGFDFSEIEKIRLRKFNERGGFNERIILEETE